MLLVLALRDGDPCEQDEQVVAIHFFVFAMALNGEGRV